MACKILYIGKEIEKARTGSEICNFNNQKILKNIFSENYYMYSLPKETAIQVFINKFFFMYPGLQIKIFKYIFEYIEETNPDFVFIETAQFGILSKKIKQKFPQCKIITFFHNIEIEYAKSYLSFKNLKSWYFYVLTKINESLSIKYSDYCLSINDNDSKKMNEIYHKEADFVMSFSVENRLQGNDIENLISKNKKIHAHECLFVGTNFFGNTDGLSWFIRDVMPLCSIHLTIIGNGMAKVFSDSEKITVLDFVDDLKEFYVHTDFVLLPIISGGGMKTKTAEAMMYGKAIIGTENAFLGYDIEKLHGIYLCKSKNDFIEAIDKIYRDGIFLFNKDIYDRFKVKHSLSVSEERCRAFFESISN